ncbi:hypothetical protein ID866_5193, partial [Astraeus odoratus]
MQHPTPSASSASPAPQQQQLPDAADPIPPRDAFPCQWLDCSSVFNDPELLYNHLCNDHIGRKSTNNL